MLTRQKLHKILTSPPLLSIYKFFIRPHPDFDDIIHDKAYNASFHENLKKTQINSLLQ